MWHDDARALGFEPKRQATKLRAPPMQAKQQHAAELDDSQISKANTQLSRAATGAAQSIDQSAAMPRLAVDLRQREKYHSRG
jgi:hypothetical protein